MDYLVQQAPPEPQAPAQADQPAFEILDETPPAQLAVEQRVMAGETITESPTRTAGLPEAEPAAPPPAEPIPPVAAAPAATPQPEAPQPRTYSEEEFRRMQSAKDRELAETRKFAREAAQKIQQQAVESQVENHLRAQEQQLAPSLGADEARRMARSPENVQYVRNSLTAQERVRQLEDQSRGLALEQEAQAMVMTARHFAQTHSVPDEDIPLLMTAPTPAQMETLAKRLGVAAAQRGQSTQERRNQVPRETPQTQLESGVSGTAAPESEDVRIQRLNNTPGWEWSKDDYKFMRGR